jgi:hypothetical protein
MTAGVQTLAGPLGRPRQCRWAARTVLIYSRGRFWASWKCPIHGALRLTEPYDLDRAFERFNGLLTALHEKPRARRAMEPGLKRPRTRCPHYENRGYQDEKLYCSNCRRCPDARKRHCRNAWRRCVRAHHGCCAAGPEHGRPGTAVRSLLVEELIQASVQRLARCADRLDDRDRGANASFDVEVRIVQNVSVRSRL